MMRRLDDLMRAGLVFLTFLFPATRLFSEDGSAVKPVKILYYTRSVSAQHPPVIIEADGESVSDKRLKKWGAENGMVFVCTKDGTVFDGDLTPFDGFAFYSAGDLDAEVSLDGSPPMSKEGKARLLEAVKNGKGFVGFHATSDSWRDVNHPPFENQESIDPFLEMLGGEFFLHGEMQDAKMLISNPVDIPWLKDKGEFFTAFDEWYCLKNFNKDIHVILTQDTTTMRNECYDRPPYPATWARLHGKGRVAYTSLGHGNETWEDDGVIQFFGELISWSVGRFDIDLTPNMEQVTPGAAILLNR